MVMIMHEACLYGMASSTSLVIFPWDLFECSSASCAGSQVQALPRQKPLDPKNAEMKEFTCCWRRRTIMLWVWWVLLVKAKEIHHVTTPAWPKVMQALPKTFDVGHHTILQLPFWLQYIIIYIYGTQAKQHEVYLIPLHGGTFPTSLILKCLPARTNCRVPH
jgi:hypothetical protein